ncbi:MAG: HAMP domain-containing protein [Treponema sp.]|jgi:adenylate cyclase|nr:HAMP domain-containing protein [Treponema sp.]
MVNTDKQRTENRIEQDVLNYGLFVTSKPGTERIKPDPTGRGMMNYGEFIGTPEPEITLKPEQKAKAAPESKPIPEVKPVPKPQAVPESKPVPEVKPVPKPQAVPESKAPPEVKPVPKPQTIPESQPLPKTEEAPPHIKVKFPIGMKLITIITILLLVSLGTITTLVSVLISSDVRLTAEDNNFNINQRVASAARTALNTIHAKVLVLLNNLNTLGSLAGEEDRSQQMSAYFFQQNPDIGAIIIPAGSGNGTSNSAFQDGQRFNNDQFFLTHELDPSHLESWIITQGEALDRARTGEVLIRNATPILGIPIMVIFCPWGSGETRNAVAIFFSLENLTETFRTGDNVSFLINDVGDVLVHPDNELVHSGVNLRRDTFVQSVLENQNASLQTRYIDHQGIDCFGAFRRLSIGNTAVITNIQAQVVFEGIEAATRRNIYLTIAVLISSVLLIWVFSRTISRPIEALTQAARQIEEGNYHLNLQNKNRDETGVLTQSVISMSHGLENFERFTNKTLARLARQGKLITGGTARKATIFFSDIRSFTAISEKLTPAEVVEFINDYMERMVKCVLITGGAIDKFIGDAVMAHWGAVEPSASPAQDALNCVKAALMMRASLRSFNHGRGGDKKPIIKIGCGINSGMVVAGQIGSDERLEYTVIGDAVSFADRTETFNKPFGTEILISEDTWHLCGQYLITEEMPTVTEKGQKKRMFAVVNIRDPKEAQDMLTTLEQIPKTDPFISQQCVGPYGPQTLAAVRELLGIPTPDLSTVNTDEEEKKYKVSGNVP